TEAQWEYACCSDSGKLLPPANQLSEYAWHPGNAAGRTHEVGQKRPNGWGFHDLHGNVMEWCRDSSETLPGGNDPEVSKPSPYRVVRGLPWRVAAQGNAGHRGFGGKDHHFEIFGFRVAIVTIGSPVPGGFESLFDGKSLAGWDGDPKFWS